MSVNQLDNCLSWWENTKWISDTWPGSVFATMHAHLPVNPNQLFWLIRCPLINLKAPRMQSFWVITLNIETLKTEFFYHFHGPWPTPRKRAHKRMSHEVNVGRDVDGVTNMSQSSYRAFRWDHMSPSSTKQLRNLTSPTFLLPHTYRSRYSAADNSLSPGFRVLWMLLVCLEFPESTVCLPICSSLDRSFTIN